MRIPCQSLRKDLRATRRRVQEIKRREVSQGSLLGLAHSRTRFCLALSPAGSPAGHALLVVRPVLPSDGLTLGSTDDTDNLLIPVDLKTISTSSGADSGLLSLNLKIAQQ